MLIIIQSSSKCNIYYRVRSKFKIFPIQLIDLCYFSRIHLNWLMDRSSSKWNSQQKPLIQVLLFEWPHSQINFLRFQNVFVIITFRNNKQYWLLLKYIVKWDWGKLISANIWYVNETRWKNDFFWSGVKILVRKNMADFILRSFHCFSCHCFRNQ